MISINIDASETERMVRLYPKTSRQAISNTVERIGLRLEREAKVEAPYVTGNLRRQIRFIHSKTTAGVVKSNARYSKYVHGQPFYNNRIKRKETPFMTNALASQQFFIRDELRAVPKRALSMLK